jgi:hypothetical protein
MNSAIDIGAVAKRNAERIKHENGTCRFCGCTNAKPCLLVEPRAVDAHEVLITPPRCAWVDGQRTLCSAPDCLSKATPLVLEAALALESKSCLCGRRKGKGFYFCYRCNQALPFAVSISRIAFDLDTRPFETALRYQDAKTYLNLYTDFTEKKAVNA